MLLCKGDPTTETVRNPLPYIPPTVFKRNTISTFFRKLSATHQVMQNTFVERLFIAIIYIYNIYMFIQIQYTCIALC